VLFGILIGLLLVGLVYGAFQLVILPRLHGNTSPLAVVVKAADGEEIGLSEGTYAFASNDGTLPLADYALKQQAASALNAGNTAQAESLWNQALAQQANDPEAQIYLEDQQVLAESSFHITIVVATMLTGSDADAVGVGFDDLQGAYVAQKMYNDQALLNGIGVVLLLANAGSDAANAPTVARQIVQAAQADPTIVGVMGWPYSSYVSNTFAIFQAAHLPMVSQTASSDLLTGISPYFFRVCPTNKSEAVAGANYARTTMGVENLILFTDPYNAYTSSLAADFAGQFQAAGGTILQTQKYTVGDSASVLTALKAALLTQVVPDAIYFAGYSDDLSVLMTYLAQKHVWPHVQIIGGDALYQIHGYASSSAPVWNRVHFTAFAYPNTWSVLGLSAREPAFFNDYTNDFDPRQAHPQTYGWNLADNDVMLSYDATLALLNAVKDVGKTQVAASDVEVALQHLNGPRAIQGVSGQIALGASGDPVNKAVVFLNVSPQGQVTMGRETVAGQFLLP
jgi:ABC-type branched-subunit amino acid transport system substrate-binding protein